MGRPPTRTAYIPQIDGLRFIAILVVVLWHISLRASRYVDFLHANGSQVESLYLWFPHGEIGVALFFMISGYVIAQPFMSRPAGQWRIGRFYLRRLRRIYPPYFIALTICLVLIMASNFTVKWPGPTTTESWFASALYLHGILFDTSSRLNPPIWSNEVEIQFYALAPLLIFGYMRLRDSTVRQTIGWLSVGALIIAASLFDLVHPFDPRFRYGLLAHAYLFVAGVILADFARTQDASVRRRLFDGVFLFGLALLGLVGFYLTRVDSRPGGGWPDIVTNAATLGAVVALYFGAMHGRVTARIMSTPWITLIGTMCYSIYLVHVVVIEALAQLLRRVPLDNPAVIWPAYILILGPACLCVSGVFYTLVERPFMSSIPIVPGGAGRFAFVRRRG